MDVLSPRMHFFVIVWFNNFFCNFVPSIRDTTILGWRPPELEVSAINSIFLHHKSLCSDSCAHISGLQFSLHYQCISSGASGLLRSFSSFFSTSLELERRVCMANIYDSPQQSTL